MPRVIGDGPNGGIEQVGEYLVAPRERGWTQRIEDEVEENLGCPA